MFLPSYSSTNKVYAWDLFPMKVEKLNLYIVFNIVIPISSEVEYLFMWYILIILLGSLPFILF